MATKTGWWHDPEMVAGADALKAAGKTTAEIGAWLEAQGIVTGGKDRLRSQLSEIGISGKYLGGVSPEPNNTGLPYDTGPQVTAPDGHAERSHDPERDGIKIKRDGSYFDNLEQAAATWQRENRPGGFYTVDLPDDQPVAIGITSDWHIGAKATDYRALKEHIGLLSSTPGVYTVLAGDLWHNHKRQRKSGVALYETMASPDEQRQWFRRTVRPLVDSGRLLGVVKGNHEGMDLEESGHDLLADWCLEEGVPYWGHGGTIRVTIGQERYYGAVRHQYPGASALNTSNNMRRLYDGLVRPLEAAHLDFIALGHLHYNDQHVVSRPGGEVHYLRAGAYLTYNEWADEKFGAWKTTPGVPIIILEPETHDAVSFKGNRLALALNVLGMLRSGKG